MKINNIKTKLPTKDESIKKFFLNCNQRKKLITDTPDHYKSYLKKAKHDLARALAEFNDGCWDWTVIKAYYAIHMQQMHYYQKERGSFLKITHV